MNDYISRQEAIDALCDNCDHGQAVCPHYPCKQFIAIAEKLTSAQSEIIRCKDCKYKNVYCFPPEYDERDYCEKHEKVTDGVNFCSWAERRIDE